MIAGNERARAAYAPSGAGIRLPTIEVALATGFVLAVMMPYLSPVPIRGMDVQPVAMVMAPVLVLLRVLAGQPALRIEVALVVVGLFSLLYCMPFGFDGVGEYIRVCAPLVIGAAIVVALVRALRLVSPAVVVFVAAAYLGGAVVQIMAPGLYAGVIAPFLSEVRFTPGSIRGPNGIAVEPSMVGNVCALLIALPSLWRVDWWDRHPILRLMTRVLSAAAVVITGSVTGILSCLLVGAALWAVRFGRRVWWSLLAFSVIALSFTVALAQFEFEGRIGEFLEGVLNNPLVLLTDLSLVLRYAGWLIAITNLASHPFGDGVGVLDSALVDRGVAFWANALNWDAYYIDAVTSYVDSTASGLASVLVRAGVFGLATVVFIFFVAVRGRYGIVRGVLLATMLINVSIATPYIWMVLALSILSAIESDSRLQKRKSGS